MRFRFPHKVTAWAQRVRGFIGRHPIAAIAVYLAITGNTALWAEFFRLENGTANNTLLFFVAFFLFVVLLTSLLLQLFNFRYVLKTILILVLLLSSVAAYFMNSYGVVLDVSMMYNIVETDLREVSELLTPGLMLYLLLLGVVPSWLVYRLQIEHVSFPRQLLRNSLVIALCVIAIIADALLFYSDYASLFRNHHHIRYLVNPVNYIYGMSTVAGRALIRDERGVIPVGLDAKQLKPAGYVDKRSVIVLVVGETARAMNFSLNGYTRDTNPRLRQEDIVNYPNVHSCGTSTHVSLPCMFSHFDRAHFDESESAYYEKLPDVLKHAGLDVLWRDNNSGCKGVCNGVETENMMDSKLAGFCQNNECYDEIMLDHLQGRLAQGDRDMVIILHQKGSHGPAYYQRYPRAFRVFMPECHSSELGNCRQAEVINSYDNTILYTDYFLSRVIDLLKQESSRYSTAMLYVSDHGESLGEHHLYLHSLPYMIAPEEQKHVPFIAWFSDRFLQEHDLDRTCLAQSAASPYSHDNLFHAVLGLTDVSTAIYQPGLDMFRPCRGKLGPRYVGAQKDKGAA